MIPRDQKSSSICTSSFYKYFSLWGLQWLAEDILLALMKFIDLAEYKIIKQLTSTMIKVISRRLRIGMCFCLGSLAINLLCIYKFDFYVIWKSPWILRNKMNSSTQQERNVEGLEDRRMANLMGYTNLRMHTNTVEK